MYKSKRLRMLYECTAILLLITFPSTLLFTYTMKINDQIFESYANQTQEQNLMLLGQMLVTEFNKCEEITSSLFDQQNIRPFYLQDTPVKGAELIHNLQMYFTSCNIVEDIFMHFFCDKYFYSTQTSYSTLSFINRVDPGSEANDRHCEAFLEKLSHISQAPGVQNSTAGRLIGRTASYDTVSYICPYYVDTAIVGVVIFLLDEEDLNTIIGNNDHQETYLFNSSADLLYAPAVSLAATDALSETWIQQQMAQTVAGQAIRSTQDEYSVTSGNIPQTRLYYIHFVKNSFLGIEKKNRRLYWFMLALSTAGGFILVHFLCSLRRMASSYQLKARSITKTFLSICRESQVLEQKQSDEAESAIRYTLLTDLLNGNIEPRESFWDKCRAHGIPLDAACYLIAIEQLPVGASKSAGDTVPGRENICCQWYVRQTRESAVWIVGLRRYVSNRQIEKATAGMALSVSSICSDWWRICDAFWEAKSGWDAQVVPQLYLSRTHEAVQSFCRKDLCEASRLLQADDVSSFLDHIHMMRAKMDAALLPVYVQNYARYQLTGLFTEYVGRADPPGSDTEAALPPSIRPDIPFEQLLAIVENYISLPKEKIQYPPLTMEHLLQFIEDHYQNADFSLQMLASHFGISLSYLSIFFKEKHGDNLLAYYTNLRMKRACEYLETMDVPLKEIANLVGYVNVSSFIRRFKQIYGITPGEYKKRKDNPEILE